MYCTCTYEMYFVGSNTRVRRSPVLPARYICKHKAQTEFNCLKSTGNIDDTLINLSDVWVEVHSLPLFYHLEILTCSFDLTSHLVSRWPAEIVTSIEDKRTCERLSTACLSNDL